MGPKKHKYSQDFMELLSHPNYAQTRHWTKFELDLIRCIKEEYPVLYKKMDDMDRYQKLTACKKAWKLISDKFEDLPSEFIKFKWKSLVEKYVNITLNNEIHFPKHRKFADGTLSFLDNESHLFKIYRVRSRKKARQSMTVGDRSETETATESSSSTEFNYDSSIRQLIHEEIDIDDDAEIKFEMENDNDNETETHNETVAETVLSNEPEGIESNEENREPEKKWDEEELMNATRLTQEMIEELIRIKTKQYYTASVVS